MAESRKRNFFITFFPIVFFIGLAVLFLISLSTSRDRQNIPSVLVGKPVPQINLAAIEGARLPGLSTSDLVSQEGHKGRVTIINVWASWCLPCRQEHPFLMQLSQRTDLRMTGLNYKDKNVQALKFLSNLGNPFEAIGVDPNGRAAIELGVYGVPETYIISTAGIITFKHVGPILSEQERKLFMQKIAEARENKKGLKN